MRLAELYASLVEMKTGKAYNGHFGCMPGTEMFRRFEALVENVRDSPGVSSEEFVVAQFHFSRTPYPYMGTLNTPLAWKKYRWFKERQDQERPDYHDVISETENPLKQIRRSFIQGATTLTELITNLGMSRFELYALVPGLLCPYLILSDPHPRFKVKSLGRVLKLKAFKDAKQLLCRDAIQCLTESLWRRYGKTIRQAENGRRNAEV